MKEGYIGIDNGVTGSIGIINTINNQAFYFSTPVKKELNYTKQKAWLNRIDTIALRNILNEYKDIKSNSLIIMERPMVNPTRWKSSVSAIRALEATLVVVQELDFPYTYVDSKEWQSLLLPNGTFGEELKVASKQVAERLFPSIKFKKDGDGILIAEWARRKQL